MKTNMKTTYILLDRGSEDVGLKKEIRNLIVAAGKNERTFDFVHSYPILNELLNALVLETSVGDTDD